MLGVMFMSGCAKAPRPLGKAAAEAALDNWLHEHSKPFFQMLGQKPPPLGNEFRVSDIPPEAKSPDPRRSIYPFSTNPGMMMIKAKDSNQFIGVSGGGQAEFHWLDGTWYLVRVEFHSGVVVEDIRWKVEEG